MHLAANRGNLAPELSTTAGDKKIARKKGPVDCGPPHGFPWVGSGPLGEPTAGRAHSRDCRRDSRGNRWCSARTLAIARRKGRPAIASRSDVIRRVRIPTGSSGRSAMRRVSCGEPPMRLSGHVGPEKAGATLSRGCRSTRRLRIVAEELDWQQFGNSIGHVGPTWLQCS